LVYEGHKRGDYRFHSGDCAGRTYNGGIDFPSMVCGNGRTFACRIMPLRRHKRWI